MLDFQGLLDELSLHFVVRSQSLNVSICCLDLKACGDDVAHEEPGAGGFQHLDLQIFLQLPRYDYDHNFDQDAFEEHELDQEFDLLAVGPLDLLLLDRLGVVVVVCGAEERQDELKCGYYEAEDHEVEEVPLFDLDLLYRPPVNQQFSQLLAVQLLNVVDIGADEESYVGEAGDVGERHGHHGHQFLHLLAGEGHLLPDVIGFRPIQTVFMTFLVRNYHLLILLIEVLKSLLELQSLRSLLFSKVLLELKLEVLFELVFERGLSGSAFFQPCHSLFEDQVAWKR